MPDITELFCRIDDLCKTIQPQLMAELQEQGQGKRCRAAGLSLSELATLMVLFHLVRFRQFKAFYLLHVKSHLKGEFPRAPSYQRCVALMPRCAAVLAAVFEALKGQCSGVSIADSTPLRVCDNLRINRHRVFSGMAARGKSSTGWFFGFKLHAIINHTGELLDIKITAGNVDDRRALKDMAPDLFGKLFADKGYISEALGAFLSEQGVELITKVRKNMKPRPISDFDKAILRKRSLVETVFDELKNLCQIEHSRHRSPTNFCVNLLGGVVAYCLMSNKPTLSAVNVLPIDSLIQN